MRIAIHSHSFAPTLGGLERFGEDLATWLAGRDHEVTVVTGTPVGQGDDAGRPYRMVRSESPRDALPVLWRADVIHVSGLSLRGIAMGQLIHQPLVVTHHGYQAICPTGLMMPHDGRCDASGHAPGPCAGCPGAGLRGAANVRAHRLGAHAAAANVGVSRYLTRRVGVTRCRTIHNGLTPAALARAIEGPGEDGVIAFAGRLVEEKGLDLLIRALTFLPDAWLEVAGDGAMRAELEDLATRLSVDGRVRFHGRLPPEGVRELYARAAVVCVPSRWHEPFGYAVSEAMALGRPIVATPMGAFTELLEGGRGILASEVTSEALARALSEALASRSARSRMGAAARRFAERELAIDAVGEQYEGLYRNVLAGIR